MRNAIRFKKVDMIPWIEVFNADETLFKFISEGLPVRAIASIEWTIGYGGSLLVNWPALTGFDPSAHFGCINLWGCAVPIDVGPIPRFKLRKIADDTKYDEYVTEVGQKARWVQEGTDKRNLVQDAVIYRVPSERPEELGAVQEPSRTSSPKKISERLGERRTSRPSRSTKTALQRSQ